MIKARIYAQPPPFTPPGKRVSQVVAPMTIFDGYLELVPRIGELINVEMEDQTIASGRVKLVVHGISLRVQMGVRIRIDEPLSWTPYVEHVEAEHKRIINSYGRQQR